MDNETQGVTSEDREECLEALCRLEQGHRPLTAGVLASEPDLAGKPLPDVLLALIGSGDLTAEGTSLCLTRKGRETGRRIVRRHQVAEHMLRSLGLRKRTAHQEACKLEHVLTDAEVADLEKRLAAVASMAALGALTLDQAEPGKTYRVQSIPAGQSVRRRLEDMGLGMGSVVRVCNRRPGGPVEVESHGACVALGNLIAQRVLVIPEEH